MTGIFILIVVIILIYLFFRNQDKVHAKKIEAAQQRKEEYQQMILRRKQEFYEDIPEATDDLVPFYFVFDVETNGLPDFYDAPPDDLENWPHPLSLGYVTLNENLELVKKRYFILDQECELDEEATSVHGLTKDIIKSKGKNPSEVYDEVFLDMKTSKKLVAHNMAFDLSVLQADFLRKGKNKSVFRKGKVCTMKKSTSIVAIPRPYGKGYKWPKLGELIASCFFLDQDSEGFEFEEAHDALWDAEATAKCFKHLIKNKEISI